MTCGRRLPIILPSRRVRPPWIDRLMSRNPPGAVNPPPAALRPGWPSRTDLLRLGFGHRNGLWEGRLDGLGHWVLDRFNYDLTDSPADVHMRLLCALAPTRALKEGKKKPGSPHRSGFGTFSGSPGVPPEGLPWSRRACPSSTLDEAICGCQEQYIAVRCGGHLRLVLARVDASKGSHQDETPLRRGDARGAAITRKLLRPKLRLPSVRDGARRRESRMQPNMQPHCR
jgi:hypothetical protein